jgi:hypothetical protein
LGSGLDNSLSTTWIAVIQAIIIFSGPDPFLSKHGMGGNVIWDEGSSTMRFAVILVILASVAGCPCCSRAKRGPRADLLYSAAEELLSVDFANARALAALRNLEMQIDRSKAEKSLNQDVSLLYEEAVRGFHLSLSVMESRDLGQNAIPNSMRMREAEQWWRVAIGQLKSAQLARRGLRIPRSVIFDPPMQDHNPVPSSMFAPL